MNDHDIKDDDNDDNNKENDSDDHDDGMMIKTYSCVGWYSKDLALPT